MIRKSDKPWKKATPKREETETAEPAKTEERSKTYVGADGVEKERDTFVFIAGIFENPKSFAGTSYKDVEVKTKDGKTFIIPKGVRFMVLETKLEGSKTPFALYAVV